MPSRNFDLSQTPSDSILVFPDIAAAPAAGSFLGATSAATKFAQLGFFTPSGTFVPVGGGTMTGPLILAGDPTVALGAATKQYTDKMLPLAGGQMAGPLALAGDPTTPLQAVTKQYTDKMLPLAGGTMTGNLFLNVDPTSALQAATKRYADSQVGTAISGLGTMSGQNANAVAITQGTAAFSQVDIAATTDLTKSLQLRADENLPADIRIVDDLGFAGVLIGSDGTINAFNAAIDTVRSLTLNATTALTLPNTTLYEVADGANHVIVQDEFGFIALIIEGNGIVDAGTITANVVTALQTLNVPVASGAALSGTALFLTNFTITDSADGLNDVLFSDDFGFVAFGIHGIDGSLIGGGGSGGSGGSTDDPNSFSPSLITSRDALATALSMAVRDNTNAKLATPIWNYNLIIAYGQSLSLGNGGGAPISTASGLDNLCLGTRCIGTQATMATFFTPATDSSFHPLDGNTFQEPPGVGLTNQWRALQLRWRGLASDPNRRFVFNCAGEGGRAIEELSKGATPNLYGKIPSLVSQVMSTATLAGGTCGVVAVYYIQGEANASNLGFDGSLAGYQAKLEQLRSDIATDIMALTGQKLPPAFITVETNSFWDSTGDLCNVGMAQLQCATTAPYGDYMASPNYQVNSDSTGAGHLSNDGYRWIGNVAGHLLHKVIDKGEGWLPLYPTGATCRGSQILLSLHTPEPPLQLQPFYGGADGSTPQAIFADCGFRAGDDAGTLTITSVALYNSVILVTCNRAVTAANHPWLQYANNAVHGGNGNVCDSDPFSLFDNFTVGTPASVGQTYPAFNWLVAFRVNVVSDV